MVGNSPTAGASQIRGLGKKMRYTIHQIRDENYNDIGSAVLAEAETAEEAGRLARSIAHQHYYGVCTMDNETGRIDFGNAVRERNDVTVVGTQRTAEAWWSWHDQDSARWSGSTDEAEARCSAWVAGESDDGPEQE